MKFSIKEHLLSGKTYPEKLRFAKNLGVQGIEIAATDQLVDQIPLIVNEAQANNLKISAVHIGHTKILHPEFDIRDRSIQRIRSLMSYSIDLGAEAIVFLPFYSPSAVLPDLHPYKSSIELEAELLITQLKATLCDLAYALGCHLYLQPANRDETHLIRQVAHAQTIRAKLKNHSHLHLAVHTYHMAKENEPINATLREFSEGVQHLYLSDDNHALPGEGNLNFAEIMASLKDINYDGWITLDSDPQYIMNAESQLKQSISMLQNS